MRIIIVLLSAFGCGDSISGDFSFKGDADTGYMFSANGCRVIVDGVDIADCSVVFDKISDDAEPFCPVLIQ